MRRQYPTRITINGRKLTKVIVDSHYEAKHSSTVNDEIILVLLQSLDGGEFEPDAISETGFEYFTTEPLYFAGKPYRLIWCTHPREDYIGIVNCFRRPHAKVPKR